MKNSIVFILLLLNFNTHSQCGYYDKITNLMKNKVCNNISYQKSELEDLLYKMSVNCPDEAAKFNRWWSGMKTDQDLKNYFCPEKASKSNQVQTSTCPTANQNVQQPNSSISQLKEKPIEYIGNTKKETTNFSNLNEKDKKKLVENIENSNNPIDFNEKEINKLLDIQEEVITKPIFDTYYYSSFSDAIYKTAEESESSVSLEDVAGYSFAITFTIKASGFIENIRFQNEKGIGSTPKINQSIKAIIFKLGMKGLWTPATKNNLKINDDVTIEIDVDRYLKAYNYLKNLKNDRKVENLKPNERYIFEEEYEERNKEYTNSYKENIKSFFSLLKNNYNDFKTNLERAKRKYKSILNFDFMDVENINAEDYDTFNEQQMEEEESIEKSNIYTHGKFRLDNKTWELVSGSATIIDEKKRYVARVVKE